MSKSGKKQSVGCLRICCHVHKCLYGRVVEGEGGRFECMHIVYVSLSSFSSSPTAFTNTNYITFLPLLLLKPMLKRYEKRRMILCIKYIGKHAIDN